jgi:hypothetical protein
VLEPAEGGAALAEEETLNTYKYNVHKLEQYVHVNGEIFILIL